jgi:tagatose 6-phosphate kinase
MILTVTLNPAVDYTVFGDTFRVYQTNRGREIAPEPGGKGNNAARIAHVLGSQVVVTGMAGGHTGEFIQNSLRSGGISSAFYAVAGLSRITLTFVEEHSHRDSKVVPSGPEIAQPEAEGFISHLEVLLDSIKPSVMVMCGSLPRGLPPSYYRRAGAVALVRKVPVILDTSGATLAESTSMPPFLVKPNLDEARELCGLDDRAEEGTVMDALERRCPGVQCVALTLGARGALFSWSGRRFLVQPPAIPTVNAVGAGDAFMGGVAAAMERFGSEPQVLMRWGVAAGACTAGSPGLTWPRDMFQQAVASVSIIAL